MALPLIPIAIAAGVAYFGAKKIKKDKAKKAQAAAVTQGTGVELAPVQEAMAYDYPPVPVVDPRDEFPPEINLLTPAPWTSDEIF